jgi:imidazolonepropionase-like amidohydrolase
MTRFLWVILLAAACVSGRVSHDRRPNLAVAAARLVDPSNGAVTGPVVVLIDGQRIRRVVARGEFRPQDADSLVDFGDLTLMPGFIDGHVHLTIGGPIAATAQADLRAGFTTVVDLGARGYRVLRVRDSINAGLIEGPRILAAGLWIGAKGGVCEFSGIGIAGDADAFRRRVIANDSAGADLSKACVTSWPADAYAKPDYTEIPEPTLHAIVEESHARHKLVVAHDLGRAGIAMALRTGVDGLAHAAYFTPELAADARRRGMFVIPTLESLTSGDTSIVSRELVRATRLARDSGVTIVFGTDGGVLPHGKNGAEFDALARAGLSPLELIRAATTNAARAFKLSDSVSVVRAGMIADLVAVRGDPLADPRALQRVERVVARGRIISSK